MTRSAMEFEHFFDATSLAWAALNKLSSIVTNVTAQENLFAKTDNFLILTNLVSIYFKISAGQYFWVFKNVNIKLLICLISNIYP